MRIEYDGYVAITGPVAFNFTSLAFCGTMETVSRIPDGQITPQRYLCNSKLADDASSSEADDGTDLL